MSRKPSEREHPLIYNYLKRFQEDPTSRIFAPLAEAYRRAGLVDEAIAIAREGLAVHPSFVGGRVALARGLFDKQKYQEVIDELRPIIQDVPDNLVAQRLVADSSLMLGRVADALDAYKMLLFYSPNDPEVGQIVRELEVQAYDQGALVLRSDLKVQSFSIEGAAEALGGDVALRNTRLIRQIEFLQAILPRIERYRTLAL